MKAGKVCFGADSVEENIKNKKVKLVIIATDSSERTKSKFDNICKKYNIRLIVFADIEKLSKAIGKENKAILGIKDNNFSSSILKKYDGGDIIG